MKMISALMKKIKIGNHFKCNREIDLLSDVKLMNLFKHQMTNLSGISDKKVKILDVYH